MSETFQLHPDNTSQHLARSRDQLRIVTPLSSKKATESVSMFSQLRPYLHLQPCTTLHLPPRVHSHSTAELGICCYQGRNGCTSVAVACNCHACGVQPILKLLQGATCPRHAWDLPCSISHIQTCVLRFESVLRFEGSSFWIFTGRPSLLFHHTHYWSIAPSFVSLHSALFHADLRLDNCTLRRRESKPHRYPYLQLLGASV